MEKILKNKISVITGAAKGIGKEVSRTFAREGSDIVLLDIDKNRLTQTVKEIKKIPVNITVYEVDISNSNEVNIIIDKIIGKYERIDILINSAGIFEVKELLDTSDELFDRVININLKGTFYCCRAVANIMKQKKYGKIINISSLAGKTKSIIAGVSYSTSKAGIIGLTRSMAAELAEYNINVNAVAPSYIETGIHSIISERLREKIKNDIPLKRVTTVEDVANLILFLSSDLSKNITGEVININGGVFMD
jgi:3-oxoacyl-[acyl-carrier protein] reductase